MVGRNLIKLLKALDILGRPRGATISELAEHLEVDRRSVYRLKELIEELRIPLYDVREPAEREKRWRIVDTYVKRFPNFTVPDLHLTLSEIIALYLLKAEAGLYRGTEIEAIVDLAFGKIESLVPGGLYGQLEKIRTLFVPSSKFVKDYSGKEEIIDSLVEAMLQRRTCYVTYHSFGDDRIKNFKIDPLHFFENNGGLYAFVNTTSFGEIRCLAVERIQELSFTDETFPYPEGFDPEKLLNSGFDIVFDDPVEVKVWFSPDQARYIRERTWAADQRITRQADGSIIVEIRTSGWWDVKKWILSFGADARVLEPEELRNALIEELKSSMDAYLGPASYTREG